MWGAAGVLLSPLGLWFMIGVGAMLALALIGKLAKD